MDLKLGFQFRSQRQEVQMAINSVEVAHCLWGASLGAEDMQSPY